MPASFRQGRGFAMAFCGLMNSSVDEENRFFSGWFQLDGSLSGILFGP
jgi:hypothetical protein